MEIITPSNIMFAIGILGVIFTIYNYFKNPQIKGEKIDALFDQRMKFLQESNDRRFAEIHDEIRAITATNQNHLHTIDTKVEALAENVRCMGLDVAKLGTIIEERIPRK